MEYKYPVKLKVKKPIPKPIPVRELAAKLPDLCAWRLPSTGEPVVIHFGTMGYHKWNWPSHLTPEDMNEGLGITPQQVEAMASGSMFGWDTAAANPDNYAVQE